MTPETNRNEKHPIQLERFKNFNPSNNHTQLQHQQQLVGNYQDCNPIDPVINNSSKRHHVGYITNSPLQVVFENLTPSNGSINCLQQSVKKLLLGLIFLRPNQSNHYQKDQNLQPPLDLLNLNGTNPSPTQRRTTRTPLIQNTFPVPSNNHQAEERSSSQGLRATGGASGAPGTRLSILGWTCKLLKVYFSETPEAASPSSSPNLLRLIHAMGLILDSFQDSACNRFSIKNSALVITRSLVRCNHQHIPELFKYLTQDSSSPQNSTLLGLTIDVSLRLRVGKEIVKGTPEGVGVVYVADHKHVSSAASKLLLQSPKSDQTLKKDFFPVLVSAAKSSKSETWETALLFFKTLSEDADLDVLAKVGEEISLPLKTGKTSGSEHRAAFITILAFIKPEKIRWHSQKPLSNTVKFCRARYHSIRSDYLPKLRYSIASIHSRFEPMDCSSPQSQFYFNSLALLILLICDIIDQTMTCLAEINSQKSTTSNYATKTVPASRIMLVAQDVGEINSLWSLLIHNYKMHLDETSKRIGAGTMNSESLDEVSSLQNQLMDLVDRTICWMNCNDENFTEGRGNCRKFYTIHYGINVIVEPVNQFGNTNKNI
ncbi:hypothetical protein PPACK8108_LOCUS21807 [Phakopsora pachyrhizi]|uniref:Uncharacterized protein n=1 Tax=Phakopsora pachyrhizi TaxID=170000 RepID=A0AAV0BIM8_PHAPC|nr:hypothetical protein PPACK8108_LOCUS21807 [Phakopsora pachyrhizi]